MRITLIPVHVGETRWRDLAHVEVDADEGLSGGSEARMLGRVGDINGVAEPRRFAATAETPQPQSAPHRVGGPVPTVPPSQLVGCEAEFKAPRHFSDRSALELKMVGSGCLSWLMAPSGCLGCRSWGLSERSRPQPNSRSARRVSVSVSKVGRSAYPRQAHEGGHGGRAQVVAPDELSSRSPYRGAARTHLHVRGMCDRNHAASESTRPTGHVAVRGTKKGSARSRSWAPRIPRGTFLPHL